MADYSHLRKLDVTQESEAEYTFDDVVVGRAEDGSNIYASIWCRPMVEANKLFLNERIRMSTERADKAAKQPRGEKKDKVQQLADRMEEDRESERKLIAHTCALRWGNPPLDVEGKANEFTPDECYAFLSALPTFMFDPFRQWVQNPYNFVDPVAFASGGGVVDGETLGNS